MRRTIPLCTTILFTLLLAACGQSAPAAAPTTAPAAAVATPASVRTPTPSEGAAPVPPQTTAAAAAAPPTAPAISTIRPAATPSASVGKGITFGPLSPFSDSRGIIMLQAPQGWQRQEDSTADKVQVALTDPSGAGFLTARVTQQEPPLDAATLEQALPAAIYERFGDTGDLEIEVPAAQPDGALQVAFSYTRNGQPYEGQGRAVQRRKLIAFILYSAPRDQWAAVRDPFEDIAAGITLSSDDTLWSLPPKQP